VWGGGGVNTLPYSFEKISYTGLERATTPLARFLYG